MKRNQPKKFRKKILIAIMLLISLFSILRIGISLASTSTFTVTGVEILKQSDKVIVNNAKVEKNKLVTNAIFYNVGDSIIYKINVKNNDKVNYTIKSIEDDNINEYISYTYNNYEGTKVNAKEETTFEITQKYVKECEFEKRDQYFKFNIIVTFEDESGETVEETIPVNSNPKTGDNIGIYIIILLSSVVLLILLLKKNKTQEKGKHSYKKIKLFSILILGVLILPNISKAAEKLNFAMIFENNVFLRDKLLISYLIGDIKYEKIVKYNEKAEELYVPEINGYEFDKWQKEDEKEFDLNEPITEDTIIKANYKPINYTISYEGLTKAEELEINNSTTYTIESDNITLNNPTRRGYIFAGWTGTDLDTNKLDVTIEKGSTGNREYTANWTPINYTIKYEGLTEEEERELNNPTNYTIETESMTLKNPSNRTDSDGDEVEKFVGWKENTTIAIDITVPPAELENKVYEAIWVTVNPNTYSVIYNLDGGTVETENRTSFTKFDTFALNNPTKRGYTFIGWTGSNETIPQENVTIPLGTRENLNYTANWRIIEYAISYNLDGGTAEENPNTYTVESDDIIINRPTKKGYTFNGWTGTDIDNLKLDVVIEKGSVGDKEYTANYSEKSYEIVFDNNNGTGSMENQKMLYDIEANLNANTFSKEGHEFIGWNTKPDGTGTPYSDEQLVLDIGNTTLYAQWMLEGAVAEINRTYYLTLQSAIDNVPNDNTETQVKLLKDISENVVIQQNQNIIFDLQNYKISNNKNDAVIINNGTIKISNGKICTTSTTSGAIDNNKTGKLVINGGEIIVGEDGKQAVYNNKGIVEISGTAKLRSESSIRATVQNVSGGTLNITGGEIIGVNYSAIVNAGNMNIGEKDGEVDNNIPVIQGTPYGINSSTDFNYYDGIIKGTTKGISAVARVNEKEIGYAIYTSQEEIDGVTYNTTYLGEAVAVICNENKENYYATIQEAINAVATDNTQTIIKILKDTTEDIIIAKDKNIEFDLQNYKITNDNNNAVITNNGTLKITNGTLESDAEFATIDNNKDANLIISGGNIISTGTRSAIYNYSGNVEITGTAYLKSTTTGIIDSLAIERGTITNTRGGILTITGGTIIGENQHAISNDSTLTIGIANDGNVNTTSPLIIGKTYGVKNTGIFNFYDGIIKGVTDSISGIITNVEMNCTRFDSTEIIDETTYKTVYLQSN